MRAKKLTIVLILLASILTFIGLKVYNPNTDKPEKSLASPLPKVATNDKSTKISEPAVNKSSNSNPPIDKDNSMANESNSIESNHTNINVPNTTISITPVPTATPIPVSTQESIPVPGAVNSKAKAIAGRDIEAEDYLKIMPVLLKKLSLSEIKLLFGQAGNDFWVNTPVEEIERIRSILFTKLSEDDLKMLRAIGTKYGRSMYIIRPDISVAQVKAEEIEQRKAKEAAQQK